jgi:hypothetical protein
MLLCYVVLKYCVLVYFSSSLFLCVHVFCIKVFSFSNDCLFYVYIYLCHFLLLFNSLLFQRMLMRSLWCLCVCESPISTFEHLNLS